MAVKVLKVSWYSSTDDIEYTSNENMLMTGTGYGHVDTSRPYFLVLVEYRNI
jgi:hypothetical protein